MPAFDLNILESQLIIAAIFVAPIIGLTASVAFITALVPSGLNKPSRLAVAGIVCALIALALATPWPTLWVLPAGGTVIGLILRATERYWILWFPITAVLALSTAVILFATGQYGVNSCAP